MKNSVERFGGDHVLERIGQRLPDLLAVVGGDPGRLRETHAEIDGLGCGGLDDADRSLGPRRIASAHVVGHGFEGSHRGRQRDALELARHFDQAFQTCHELHAPSVLHDGVDLVEDHGLDRR